MRRNFFIATLTCLTLFISLVSFAPDKIAGLVQDVFIQTNQFRKSKGKTELIIRDDLNNIAQKHSADMAAGRVGFGHAGFDKRNSMAKEIIQPLKNFAENVAFGASSGKEVVAMWKNSSGHRKNMLGSFTYIGIGVARDKNGQFFYTQVFAK